MMWTYLVGWSYAAPPPPIRDLSATSVGFQHWQAPAQRGVPAEEEAPSSDTELLLGQRLRWGLIEKETTSLSAHVDARFTLALGDEALFKRNRVRQLGVQLRTPSFTLDVGRSRVFKGGPRLVDGAQLLVHAGKSLDIGGWAGLQPDLFSTDPRLRPGGGPIVAFTTSRVQASVLGEVVMGSGPDGFGVDRASTLLQGRVSAARTIEVSGRLDVDFVGAGPRVQDGQAFVRWAPAKRFTMDVLYNAFSNYLYQRTQDVDPDIQRFDKRALLDENLVDAVIPLLDPGCVADPKVAHMVGTDLRFRAPQGKAGLTASLSARARMRNIADPVTPGAASCWFDDTNDFVRVSPRVGLSQLPVGGSLDVSLDANLYQIDGRQQADAGVSVYFEPTEDGVLAVDASYRMLFNAFDPVANPNGYVGGMGHYGDLFVDVVLVEADLMVGVGLNVESEPSDVVKDAGFGGFARVTKYLRRRRK